MPAIEIPISLRWGDQDPYGHVNNVAIARILEEARARAFWAEATDPVMPDPEAAEGRTVEHARRAVFPPLTPDQPVWALVSELSVRYLRPVNYQREPVTVAMTVSRIGGASFTIDYRIRTDPHDPAHLQPHDNDDAGAAPESLTCVQAQTTLVLVDQQSGSPVRLSHEQRAMLQTWSP